ncbi:MAG: hypothetical protein JXA77_01650 [Bacteroidales bacterium]|nr:hypothetical protein [Bacteroidales bacterium]MBN2820147.1 hypothetical protein [Bacteroidales bacterium]
MRVLLIIWIALSSMMIKVDSFFGVNYIGMSKNEIKQMISENHKALKLNTVNTNDKYNYLKYEDRINEITVLFFLSEDDNCTLVRLMSDYSNINDILDDLNSIYIPIDKSNWKFKDAENLIINLEEGDWFFTITIREKDKE